MDRWRHLCNRHDFGKTLGDGEGQRGLTCCSPWGHEELDVTGPSQLGLIIRAQLMVSSCDSLTILKVQSMLRTQRTWPESVLPLSTLYSEVRSVSRWVSNVRGHDNLCYSPSRPKASLVSQQSTVYLQYGRCGLDPWVRKIPWRMKWQPTPIFLPGQSH